MCFRSFPCNQSAESSVFFIPEIFALQVDGRKAECRREKSHNALHVDVLAVDVAVGLVGPHEDVLSVVEAAAVFGTGLCILDGVDMCAPSRVAVHVETEGFNWCAAVWAVHVGNHETAAIRISIDFCVSVFIAVIVGNENAFAPKHFARRGDAVYIKS